MDPYEQAAIQQMMMQQKMAQPMLPPHEKYAGPSPFWEALTGAVVGFIAGVSALAGIYGDGKKSLYVDEKLTTKGTWITGAFIFIPALLSGASSYSIASRGKEQYENANNQLDLVTAQATTIITAQQHQIATLNHERRADHGAPRSPYGNHADLANGDAKKEHAEHSEHAAHKQHHDEHANTAKEADINGEHSKHIEHADHKNLHKEHAAKLPENVPNTQVAKAGLSASPLHGDHAAKAPISHDASYADKAAASKISAEAAHNGGIS